jgi:hypothetical protein
VLCAYVEFLEAAISAFFDGEVLPANQFRLAISQSHRCQCHWRVRHIESDSLVSTALKLTPGVIYDGNESYES